PFLCRRERRCSSGFVVVLDKPKEFCLVSKVGAEMETYTLRIAMLQAVVEPLVVTKVEPLLLQLPFEVPVSLGNKKKFRISGLNDRNKIAPVFRCRRFSRATAPGAFEDRIEQQHRHVAANTVALAGDTQNRFEDGATKLGLESIQLQHILPGWK